VTFAFILLLPVSKEVFLCAIDLTGSFSEGIHCTCATIARHIMLSIAKQESRAYPVACCTKLVGIKDGGKEWTRPYEEHFEASRGKTSFPHVTSDLLTPPWWFKLL
jgi:hypothetical protein